MYSTLLTYILTYIIIYIYIYIIYEHNISFKINRRSKNITKLFSIRIKLQG